jgi:NAD-dependent histone deacetylase SIR2
MSSLKRERSDLDYSINKDENDISNGSSNSHKRQNIDHNNINVEEGLSTQNIKNNSDAPSELTSDGGVNDINDLDDNNDILMFDSNGKHIKLEVIDSSSDDDDDDDESDNNNDIIVTNTNNKEGKNSKSNKRSSKDNNNESSSDNDYIASDSDSDISEFEFENLESPNDETILNLYDENFKLPPLNKIRITKKACFQIRKYLKSEGHGKFLDLFLPAGPTADDIFTLVKLLGYLPPKIKKLNLLPSEVLLRTSIACLKNAINKVLRTRTRLNNFYTIDHVSKAIENAKNILVLTGAGISTSLGIPDFRSSKGFYSKMKNLGLDDPQEVFSLELFKRDPSIFYSIAYMILPPEHSFTPLHAFIKLLQDKGKLLRNYTQNIDNLEGNVGVEPEKLVQCHGSFATASCISCKYKIPGETLYPNLRSKKIAYCPFCESERKALLKKFDKHEDEGLGTYSSKFEYIESFGVMKPDITFFGENLPDRYHNTIKEDIRNCDLLITIGTSLKVAPVSEIVNRVPNDIPQILINRDPINHCEFDVEFLGYCDQAITWLCGEKLKWQIDHKDFQKILHSGLVLDIVDEEYGRYKITDANERLNLSLKKLEEQKKAEKDSN